VSDQLNQWMNQERANNDAKRAADRSRESTLLNFEKDQRARQSSGSYKPSPEWTPTRTPMDSFVLKALGRPDPSAEEPAPSHLAAPGEWPEDEEGPVRSAAWASLDESTQLAALDVGGPGFAEASDRFADAVVVAREAATRANAEQMHRDAMARDPETYGRP
jgi:hypothetical protein